MTTLDHDDITAPFPEVATLFLLIVPVVGWVLGVVIAWRSAIWTRRDKIVATVVGPGGLPTLLSVLVLDATHAKGKMSTAGTSEAVGIAVAAALLVASFASVVYLGVRLRTAQTIAVE
ncbi:MAG: hypothetical protein QOD30_1123 [Actinomycetota bacterium]|nr:hypothetical protein [Actinomycetota bacterium]